MKRILLIAGVILILISLVSIGQSALNYSNLTEYEMGVLWGKGIIFCVGILLVYFGLKKKRVP